MQVVDAFDTLLAADEIVRHQHRTRAEQRHDRDQITESVRLNPLDQIAHTARLELKYRCRLTTAQQLVSRFVIHRNRFDIDFRIALLSARHIDRRDRLVDDRQSLQPQEVELDESNGLQVILVELRERGALGVGVEGHRLGQRVRRNDDASRMRTRVACKTFELFRQVD